jgi:hypothetical protein
MPWTASPQPGNDLSRRDFSRRNAGTKWRDGCRPEVGCCRRVSGSGLFGSGHSPVSMPTCFYGKTRPHASRLVATRAELTWKCHDVHGLLWPYLINAPIWSMDAYALPPKEGNIWQVSTGIKRNPALQLQALSHLAGTGSQPHRRPNARYSIRQVADAQGQVSPRSFPAAFRQVVKDSAQYCRKYGSALHPATIRDRIRQAATTRVQEILPPIHGCGLCFLY